MAGMLRKGMSWLGLGPDDEYNEYDDYDDEPIVDLTGQHAAVRPAPVVRSVPAPARPPVSRVESPESWDEPIESSAVRVLPSAAGSTSVRSRGGVAAAEPIRPRGVVRPVPASPQPTSARPHVVNPKTFNDAQEVGDWFRKRQPVIVNLQDLDRDLARRLLDFSSGVAYGLGGSVERVASHVYLLSPLDVEISQDDRRRLRESGLVEE
ncbi:MAG TPA: cell division protein SepF [Microthrixaceae bacterium]|nr:cell division protein SepF [Microthrixaceae bacterium]HNI33887.1 cell division protein SepF [Microthrixaceae bacterium]